MLCAHCQCENKEGRKFCAACGAALARPCEECGYANDALDRFCGGCGRPLGRREPVSAKPHASGEGDRRPVAVMFCDIVGYTRLSSKLDPEEVHALLERFFAVVDGVVDRYGGVIDKHIGDAAMALFGAPRAHGDDALRAVRTALDVQAAVAGLSAATSEPLAVHVGIAMGEVVASTVGSGQHRGYTVTGEAANVAARLLGLAGAGETFVSEEVYRATSLAAVYEPLGAQPMKGLGSAVEVWRLTGMRRGGAVGSPLVGRRAELKQCRDILSAIGEGASGAVIVVRGEPGIGKTRLVEEVQSIAANMGFARHMGWVLDFGTERGHGAVRTIVSGLLGLGRDASSQEAEAALSTSALSGDDTLYARDLLEIPQREEDRLLYEAIDRTARARAKERVLVDLIEAAAHANPLLVTVEDVHWADPETLALLAALARATTRSRTAVVMSTRIGADPFDAAWRMAAGDGLQLTINLTSLAPAEAETIARNFPAAEAFAAKCVERAGGNPLFLEQLLRTAGDLVEGKLPTTIQSVVLARTDLLAPNDRLAIEAASVLGQRLALANLRALIDDPHYACDALLRNALLRPVADGLQFVHALVRDGVYASLTRDGVATFIRLLRRCSCRIPRCAPSILISPKILEAPQAYLEASRDQESLFRQEQASTSPSGVSPSP